MNDNNVMNNNIMGYINSARKTIIDEILNLISEYSDNGKSLSFGESAYITSNGNDFSGNPYGYAKCLTISFGEGFGVEGTADDSDSITPSNHFTMKSCDISTDSLFKLLVVAQKRCKELKEIKSINGIIDKANEYLCKMLIKDETNPVFVHVCHMLLKMGVYNGFNYFKFTKSTTGKIYLVLAGSATNFDVIQIHRIKSANITME